jgi:ATP diphosphatase
VFEKVGEELEELRQELQAGNEADKIRDETGDLLFAVVNLARHVGVDPESALRQSNRKFTRRFHEVETQCHRAGTSVQQTDLATLDSYWEQAKLAE